LIAEDEAVRRVSAEGVITTVAANPRAVGSSAAPSVPLGEALAVAVTSDGGFLIADADNSCVWRVSPDGAIHIAAGRGPPSVEGDGGPATSAFLGAPSDVAVTPDGGFLIADSSDERVRAVSPEGIITTVAGPGPPSYFFSPGQLYGGPSQDYTLDTMIGVAFQPGGFLISDAGVNSAILSVTTPSAPRLAVALRAPRITHRAIRFFYTATMPATVRLDVVAIDKSVAHLEGRTTGGRSSIVLTKPLPAGLYALRMEATGAAGQRAQSRLGVFIIGDLTLREAREAARRKAQRLEGSTVSVTQCRQFSRTRADCVLKNVDYQYPCDTVASLRLRPGTGLVYFRDYECRSAKHGGPFAPHPKTHRGANLVT
jgi:hypothetical protein